MSLPGYDDWKTHDPADDRCEFCGADAADCRDGWTPVACSGKCGKSWRDPDYEYDKMRDERDFG
jgi:hypothetical protein